LRVLRSKSKEDRTQQRRKRRYRRRTVLLGLRGVPQDHVNDRASRDWVMYSQSDVAETGQARRQGSRTSCSIAAGELNGPSYARSHLS